MWKEVEVSWYEVLPRYLFEMPENNHESLCQENITYIMTNFFQSVSQSVSVFQRPIFFLEDSSALPSGYNSCRSFNIFNDLFL